MDSAKYARHIGRVGALAVVLGVGAAVATTPGVALAGPSDTGSSSASDTGKGASDSSGAAGDSSPSQPSTSDDASDGGGNGVDQDSSHSGHASNSGATDDAEGDDGGSDLSDADADADADADVDLDGASDPSADADGGHDILPVVHKNDDSQGRGESTRDMVMQHDSARFLIDDVDRTADVDHHDDTGGNRAAAMTSPMNVVQSQPLVATMSLSPSQGVQQFSTTAVDRSAAARPLPAAAPPMDPLADLQEAIVSITTTITKVLLSPIFNPGPTTPVDPPLVWALVAFVRREIQRTFFNQTPDAVDNSLTADEDTPVTIDVLSNDTDAEGDAITITSFTQPTTAAGVAAGAVSQDASGAIIFTPAQGFTGTATFTYSVRDRGFNVVTDVVRALTGQGPRTDTATVTVTVKEVNKPPVAVDDIGIVREGTGPSIVDVLTNDSDPEGGPIFIANVTDGTGGGVVRINSDLRTLAYTPKAGFVGTETFTYTVSDLDRATATGTVTVTVTPAANEVTQTLAVDADPSWIEVTEDGKRAYVSTADGVDYLDWNATTDEWAVSGGFRVGTDPGRILLDSTRLGYVLNKGDGDLSVVDLATNREVDTDLNTPELDRLAVGYATDVALGDRLLYAVDSDGELSWYDTATYERVGSLNVNFQFRSAASETATARTAAPTSAAPSLLAVTADKSRVVVASRGRLTVVDTRRVAASALARSAAPAAVVDSIDLGGEVTAVRASADGRSLYATVRTEGGTKLAAIDISRGELQRIGDVAIAGDARAIAISRDGNRAVVTSDADVLSIVDLRSRTVVDTVRTGATVGVAVVPGRDRVLVVAPDANAVSVVKTPFTPPVAVKPDNATVDEDTSVDIDVLANDIGDDLTASVVTGPRNGTVEVSSGGTFTYTPNTDFNGEDSFTYTAGDGTSFGGVATVSITVNSVADAPVANQDTASTDAGSPVTINVLANDTDPDRYTELRVTSVTQPTNGTVTYSSDGTVTYAPNAGFDGVDTFSYTVSDGTLSSDGSVSVTVNPAVEAAPITITLRWDDNPADLDAHLLGWYATAAEPNFHVFYRNRFYNVDGTSGETGVDHAVALSTDYQDGYGPEVIQINTRTPGRYLYFVNKFRGGESLAQSHAVVSVLDPRTGTEPTTFVVDVQSEGDYWSVFTLTISDDGSVTIEPNNVYSSGEPTFDLQLA